MEEYDLTLDDVRWYLASRLAASLLGQGKEEPDQLTRRIWSGALEGELYAMEERFLASLQEELDRRLTDEAAVRDQLERVRTLKIRRR